MFVQMTNQRRNPMEDLGAPEGLFQGTSLPEDLPLTRKDGIMDRKRTAFRKGVPMGRRTFLSRLASWAAFAGILTSPVVSLVSSAVAGAKKVLIPRRTSRDALIDKNPGHLDPRNLDLTPLKEFETMGLSDHRVSLERWRLRVEGKGDRGPGQGARNGAPGHPPIHEPALQPR